MTRKRLFVYGSLKRGFRHHDRLAGAHFLGPACTAPGFRLILQGDYPALARGGKGRVCGELYLLAPEALRELDRFEGCPELYRRTTILLDDGSTALCYVISPERALGLPEIASGLWVEKPS